MLHLNTSPCTLKIHDSIFTTPPPNHPHFLFTVNFKSLFETNPYFSNIKPNIQFFLCSCKSFLSLNRFHLCHEQLKKLFGVRWRSQILIPPHQPHDSTTPYHQLTISLLHTSKQLNPLVLPSLFESYFNLFKHFFGFGLPAIKNH